MSDGGRLLPMAEQGRLPRAEPVVDRVAIVGLGATGGSIGLAIRQAWPQALIVGVDAKDVLQQAVHLHAIDVGATDVIVAADVELIVLASTAGENLATMQTLPEYVTRPCVVTAVDGDPVAMAAVAAGWPASLTFVAGRPIVTAAGTGLAAAQPDLFVGRVWEIGPADPASPSVEMLSRFVRGLGAVPQVTAPGLNDRPCV